MKHTPTAVAIALAAALQPLALLAADAPLAISARIVGYCRFVEGPMPIDFGEIVPTAREVIEKPVSLRYECSDGVAGQIQVDGKAQGPVTRHLTRVGSSVRLPYQIDWTAPSAAQTASPGMASSTVTLTGKMLPAHYRVAPAAFDYFDLVTLTINP